MTHSSDLFGWLLLLAAFLLGLGVGLIFILWWGGGSGGYDG